MKSNLLIILSLFMFGGGVVANEASPIEVQAFSYYSKTGDFSDNIFSNPKFNFWNAMLRSQDTLIKVWVAKTSTFSPSDIRVKVKTGKSNWSTYSREIPISGFAKGRYSFPILLAKTGCEPIRIIAMAIDGKNKKASEIELPSSCGE